MLAKGSAVTSSMEHRSGIRVYATRDAARIDFDGLGHLAEDAWRCDYAGKVRIVYDVDYFNWLLADGADDWIAVIAVNESEEPVGCLISLLRTVSYAGHDVPGLYSTAWMVAPDYRSRNVAIRLARAHTAAITAGDERHVGLSMFHAGHSGMRSQAVFGGANTGTNESGTRSFHRGALWSKRLDSVAEISTYDTSRLTLASGRLHSDSTVLPPTLDEYRKLIASVSAAFAPTESYARLYLSDSSRSGTRLVSVEGTSRCIASYVINELTIDDIDIGRVGHIQCVFGDQQAVGATLDVLCTSFRDAGCVSASLHHQGCIDDVVLEQHGFTRSRDELIINMWATSEASALGFPGFDRVASPYLIDFL
jgi:hypothetical protein